MPQRFLEQMIEAWVPREEGIEGLGTLGTVCQELAVSRGPVGPEGQDLSVLGRGAWTGASGCGQSVV